MRHKKNINFSKIFVMAFFAISITAFAIDKLMPFFADTNANITKTDLSTLAKSGEIAFAENCASCHGKNGVGTENGPPLVHNIYNPGHHPDESFYAAVKKGVRQHHWPFGNMPALPQVSQNEIRAIVEFVREMQEANGIKYRKHVM